MNDLRAQFHDLEMHHAILAPHALSEIRQAAVSRHIVRSRRTRTFSIAAAGFLVAAGVGAAAWGVGGVDREEPATPSVSTVTSSAPSPTESSAPSEPSALTMPAFSGIVTVDTRLPSAEAITPEAWNAAGPGWVLATYREAALTWDDANLTSADSYGPHVAYLISPEADRYELTVIGGEEPIRVVEWDPGEVVALAVAGEPFSSEGRRWVTLDLTTGSSRPVTAADVDASSWSRPTSEAIVSSGAGYGGDTLEEIAGFEPLLALEEQEDVPRPGDLEAARATAQALVPAGEECLEALALDTAVVVACGSVLKDDGYDVGGGWFAHYFVFVAESGRGQGTVVDVRIPTEYGNDTVTLDRSSVRDTVVAIAINEGFDPCWAGRYSVSTSGATPLPGVESIRQQEGSFNIFYDAGTVDTAAYTLVTGGCSGDSHPSALVRDNVATGDFVVLIPLPSSWVEAPDGVWTYQSISGAYVVPEAR